MTWRPTPAGPRNQRELFHWLWKQFQDIGNELDNGGGGGGIESVIGGTDISVDNSDPNNPIVNYTGTGEVGPQGPEGPAGRGVQVFFQSNEPGTDVSAPGDVWFVKG